MCRLLLWLPSCLLSSPLTSVLLFSSSLCSSPLIVRLVLICVTLTCPSLFIEVHVFPLVLVCHVTPCAVVPAIIFCFLWCFLCLMMNFWLILVFTQCELPSFSCLLNDFELIQLSLYLLLGPAQCFPHVPSTHPDTKGTTTRPNCALPFLTPCYHIQLVPEGIVTFFFMGIQVKWWFPSSIFSGFLTTRELVSLQFK